MSNFKKILNILGYYSTVFLLLAMFKTTENDIWMMVLIVLIFAMINYKNKLLYFTTKTEEKKHGNIKSGKRTRVKGRKV